MCINALNFCRETLAQGNSIDQIFFYQAGVIQANGLLIEGNNSDNFHQQWKDLSEKHALPLLVCVGAATKRGIIDKEQAEQSGLSQYTLFPPFQQVGLGEFFTLLHNSNQLVQF